jgi:hypothetical protein
MKGFQSLLVAATFVSLVGCNQGSDTSLNGGGYVGWTIPRVGTGYVFQFQPVKDSAIADTIFILGTGERHGSKSNVIRFGKGGNGGEGFFAIEPNGDFSLGDSSSDSFTWTTYPTGNRKNISDPKVDTIDFGEHLTRSRVRSYVGTERLTVAGRSLSTVHVRESYRRSSVDTSSFFGDSTTTTTDIWLAPSLSFIVREHYQSTSNGSIDEVFDVNLIQIIEPK